MSLGAGIRTARTVDIAKGMKTSGFDWLFIDLQHGPMSIAFATTIAGAALDTGISSECRDPDHDREGPHLAKRALVRQGSVAGDWISHWTAKFLLWSLPTGRVEREAKSPGSAGVCLK
jgi:hypothetical protein